MSHQSELTDAPGMAISPDEKKRDLRASVLRGWRRRCPSCGSGSMMKGYLKVRDECPVCGEELHHHRADDGPAYLSVLIVGFVMVPLLAMAHIRFSPDPMVLATLFSVGSVAMALYLLPRLKGMIIAFQWARKMHGFGGETT